MNTNKLLQTVRSGWSVIVVIALTTLAIIAISIYCLASGYFIIFQNLFYIPIIIACMYYTKRGFAFSVIIACLYFLLTLAFTRESSILLQAFVRVLIFVLVAGVITYLSLVRIQLEKELRQHSENLENLAEERTAELVIANKTLQAEASERKQAEEALAESEKKLRALFETMSEGIVYMDHDGKIISANPAAERLLGLSFDQMQGRTSVDPRWKAIHADGSPFPGDTHSLNVAAKTGKPATGEVMGIYNPKSCAYIWLSVNSTPEFLPGEKIPFRAYAVFRDITERKQAEDLLRALSARQEATLASIPDILMEVDQNKVYTWANPVGLEFFGEGVIGKEAAFYFEGEQETYDVVKPIFGGNKEVIYVESWQRRKDGGKRLLAWWCRVLLDADGNITGALSTGRDITERKHAEEKLKEYSEHLEEMMEERTRELHEAQEQLVRKEKLAVMGQLAGSVGHELRNPLGVINTAIYYLKTVQPDADGKIKRYHAMIEQEVHNADKIITDLLDFARGITAERKPVSIPELLQRVIERFPVPASVELKLEIPADLPMAFADPRQVEQVLGNLVTNAYQAMASASSATGVPTPRTGCSTVVKISGKLEVISDQSAERTPSSPRTRSSEWVRIAVKDTGTGISPENMPKLFEPLFTTKAKGIGLGLAVSRKLAEANGGRIEVESELGKGSTFTLFLALEGTGL